MIVILGLDPGIHLRKESWIPAYAGMTNQNYKELKWMTC